MRRMTTQSSDSLERLRADQGGAVNAKLYVIPGSHACRAAMLALDHKGIPYRPVELRTGFHGASVRARGFKGRTVPALRVDGRRVQTNREIARVLDELKPEPPLFPADPARRRAIEEAERFADEVLQPTARRIVLAAGMRDLGELTDRASRGRLGPLLAHTDKRRARVFRIAGRFAFRITEETERRDLDALPGLLDRVDALIETGVLGGDEPNAADLQIAPSICLLSYRPDLRPEIEPRPAWALATQVVHE
jgi:glutathione S-transferase